MENISAVWIRENADALAAVINATRQLAQQPMFETPYGYCVMSPLQKEFIPRADSPLSTTSSFMDHVESLVNWVTIDDDLDTLDPKTEVSAISNKLRNDYEKHRSTLSQNMDTILEARSEEEEHMSTDNVSFEEGLEQPQGGGCHVRVTLADNNKPVASPESSVYSAPRCFRSPEASPPATSSPYEIASTATTVRISPSTRQEMDEVEIIDVETYDPPPFPRPYWFSSPQYDVLPPSSPRSYINPRYYMRDVLREGMELDASSPSYSPMMPTTPMSPITHCHTVPIPSLSPSKSQCSWLCWRSRGNHPVHAHSNDHYSH